MKLETLTSISPVDGRYSKVTQPLSRYFSEESIIRYRVLIEIEYFIALCELPLPQLKLFDQSQLDLILVEGFKAERFPKIELHRPSMNKPLLYPNDPDIFAIATDGMLETPGTVIQLDINQPVMIAAFILNQFLRSD